MALVGEDFGDSGLSMLVGPEAYLGLTDKSHPVPIIRPNLYLYFLKYLDKNLTDEEDRAQLSHQYLAGINSLEGKIAASSKKKDFNRRFEAIPARTYITLAQMRKALLTVTEKVLESNLVIFEGKKLGAILIEGALKVSRSAEVKPAALKPWATIEDGPFVLDLSHMVAPSYAVPISMGDWWDDILKIWIKG